MLIEATRGRVVETRHRVHAAVIDHAGNLVAHAGDAEHLTFWRSGAKPFQAFPLVADGVVDHFGITLPELALCCASHSSEPAQLQQVRELLAKVGCGERDLLCGPHPPLSEAMAREYTSRGVQLTAVYSNCSGKHAGMLALARYHGWPVAFYTRPEHPVQQRCLAEVSRWSEVPAQAIGTAVDGCGVVCFALPISGMARAYGRLANAEFEMRNAESQGRVEPGTGTELPFRTPYSAFRIVEAMLRHPELIAGRGRPCTDMMRAHPGRVVVKTGAAGVYCGLLIQERLGIALKVEDGNGTAAALAMAAILEQLGVRPQPDALRAQAILNTRGEKVGELRAIGALKGENDPGEMRPKGYHG